ncbi:MAG: ribosome maturation factor RimP [Actinomycetota bacterium]
MSEAVVARVTSMVAPLVADLKLDLYDIEYRGGVLRITVDTPPGSPGGVDLDAIALLTRMIGRDFDHDDPMPGHYTLEVTSPGLERTLRVPAHWQREIGKTVNVRLRDIGAGDRRVQGTLIAATDTEATLRLDDAELTERVIPYTQVDRAKTVFVWGAAPKPGKAPSNKPGAKKAAKSGTTSGSKTGAKAGSKAGTKSSGTGSTGAEQQSTPTTSDPSEAAGSRKEAQEAS